MDPPLPPVSFFNFPPFLSLPPWPRRRRHPPRQHLHPTPHPPPRLRPGRPRTRRSHLLPPSAYRPPAISCYLASPGFEATVLVSLLQPVPEVFEPARPRPRRPRIERSRGAALPAPACAPARPRRWWPRGSRAKRPALRGHGGRRWKLPLVLHSGERMVALADSASRKVLRAGRYRISPPQIELLLTPQEKAILDQHETPDVSKISSPKWHPLHSYALALQIPLMDKLLDSGVDINSLDNDGATPLHYAVQAGALQTVKLLIKYKVDVNIADNHGWTLLHLAIQSINRDIAKVLLVNGADRTRRTKDGRAALDLSLCFGRDFKSYDLAKLVKLIPANRV